KPEPPVTIKPRKQSTLAEPATLIQNSQQFIYKNPVSMDLQTFTFFTLTLLLFSTFSSSSAINSTCGLYQVTDHQMADSAAPHVLGGVHDSPAAANSNSDHIEGLARFAVDEHNKKENAVVEFLRVVEAKEQVVAGTMHHLVIEAADAGKKKLYQAKVWVKPWMNFKELQEFKHSGDSSPQLTSSDLGVKKGLKDVASHDPAVQDAANHALKTIQQRSNSLFPYELQEVADAKAEVVEDTAKFHLVLKVKRGSTEEKLKVEVHKNNEGTFHLNHMEQAH
ncbi:Cysteine proteinase inhibitor 12, partial [Linum perenne]